MFDSYDAQLDGILKANFSANLAFEGKIATFLLRPIVGGYSYRMQQMRQIQMLKKFCTFSEQKLNW